MRFGETYILLVVWAPQHYFCPINHLSVAPRPGPTPPLPLADFSQQMVSSGVTNMLRRAGCNFICAPAAVAMIRSLLRVHDRTSPTIGAPARSLVTILRASAPDFSERHNAPATAPNATMRPRQNSFHGRDARHGSTGELERLEQAQHRARGTTLRRRMRLRPLQRDLEGAKPANKEAAAASSRYLEAVARANRVRGLAAAPIPSLVREQGVTSWSRRPGDAAFFKCSVLRMASSPREELSSKLADTVVAKASAFLASVGRRSMPEADLL